MSVFGGGRFNGFNGSRGGGRGGSCGFNCDESCNIRCRKPCVAPCNPCGPCGPCGGYYGGIGDGGYGGYGGYGGGYGGYGGYGGGYGGVGYGNGYGLGGGFGGGLDRGFGNGGGCDRSRSRCAKSTLICVKEHRKPECRSFFECKAYVSYKAILKPFFCCPSTIDPCAAAASDADNNDPCAEDNVITPRGEGRVLALLELHRQTKTGTLHFNATYMKLSGPVCRVKLMASPKRDFCGFCVFKLSEIYRQGRCDTDIQCQIVGQVELDCAQIAQLNDEQFFVKVDTTAFPNGEIAGYLIPQCD